MEIFLVEDSAPVRERLQAMLSKVPGAHVSGHATQARAAIRDILELKPDVVVLDLKLDEGSGFDVLKEVHRQEPGIDFYMLSNFASEPYRSYALRLGARDFFDKTSEFERVREVIAKRAAAQLN
ncbi:MAG TPA: response regulator [Burkholderiales bacterium]|nr:response regulator [Burkholderiales bacterium]